jgi:hypothetical protein
MTTKFTTPSSNKFHQLMTILNTQELSSFAIITCGTSILWWLGTIVGNKQFRDHYLVWPFQQNINSWPQSSQHQLPNIITIKLHEVSQLTTAKFTTPSSNKFHQLMTILNTQELNINYICMHWFSFHSSIMQLLRRSSFKLLVSFLRSFPLLFPLSFAWFEFNISNNKFHNTTCHSGPFLTMKWATTNS